jgi:misacylated tRNA(Ala) deacylase
VRLPHQETTVAPFTVGQGVLPTGSTGHANARTEPSITEELFRDDATLTSCEVRITCIDERGVQLERTNFFPLGGGQAGDRGALILRDGSGLQIADTHNGAHTGEIQHVPAARQEARLDFNIVEPLDKGALTAGLARLVGEASPVRHRWIAESELDANPGLVRSMGVQPPRGLGRVRVIEIEGVDLQPCGTHVGNTAEIGAVVVTRIEKKSAMTRRVVLAFAGLATRAN